MTARGRIEEEREALVDKCIPYLGTNPEGGDGMDEDIDLSATDEDEMGTDPQVDLAEFTQRLQNLQCVPTAQDGEGDHPRGPPPVDDDLGEWGSGSDEDVTSGNHEDDRDEDAGGISFPSTVTVPMAADGRDDVRRTEPVFHQSGGVRVTDTGWADSEHVAEPTMCPASPRCPPAAASPDLADSGNRDGPLLVGSPVRDVPPSAVTVRPAAPRDRQSWLGKVRQWGSGETKSPSPLPASTSSPWFQWKTKGQKVKTGPLDSGNSTTKVVTSKRPLESDSDPSSPVSGHRTRAWSVAHRTPPRLTGPLKRDSSALTPLRPSFPPPLLWGMAKKQRKRCRNQRRWWEEAPPRGPLSTLGPRREWLSMGRRTPW